MIKIELIGIPGSGKSTIREIFAEYLKAQNISHKIMREKNNFNKIKKTYHFLIFIFKYFTFTLYLIKELLKTNNRLILFQRFSKNFYFYEIEHFKPVTIFDAGFVHMGVEIAINSVCDKNLKRTKLIEYCHKTLKPDLIFHVRTDWKIAKERMLKRNTHVFLKKLTDEEISNYYKQYTEYFEIIVNEMKKSNVKIIEITNNEDLSSLEKKLKLYFNKIIH